ncbi:alpha-L-fucosidase [Micromonospora sp. NPDC093277]|uniref:alpha-L-fucosidase n=1 Tax=Micromonospora sp. NPDC093277 TaxID=3364291 RepID=UPI00381C977D
MTLQPWFADAKLGIFVHWGIYAVNGITESWSMFNGEISPEDYLRQLDGFTAARFEPDVWAELFHRAGARYAVLTAKHHDGVALWDTHAGDLSVVRRAPAGRDLVAGYAAAMRRRALKVGLYFSHADWSHPDYATVRGPVVDANSDNPLAYAPPGRQAPERWERFLAFHRAQLDELLDRFAPDLLWFDGQWERDESQWRFAELGERIRARAPHTVVNGRLAGFGDYATPEQGLPVTAPDGPWELCLTVNDSWGYRPQDRNHKSVRQLVRTFAEVIGAGGNLLLDVGPKADGTITREQTDRLLGLGDWIGRNRDAVYGTRAGLPPGHHYGPSTLSADRRVVYLVCFDAPREFVAVRGLRNAVRRVSVLHTGAELAHRVVGGFADVPGVLYLDAPTALDEHATVLAVELDGELDLYRGDGHG